MEREGEKERKKSATVAKSESEEREGLTCEKITTFSLFSNSPRRFLSQACFGLTKVLHLAALAWDMNASHLLSAGNLASLGTMPSAGRGMDV